MFDLNSLLSSSSALVGILIVAAIVFAESGLLIGFFLPGDTLLLGAGILASQGNPPLGWLIFATVAAAIIGDNVGYTIGQRTGQRIFNKKDGILFQQEHIRRAEKFYEEHGGKTIILARFIPIVRTFAPVVAGVGNMSRKRFFAFNIIGGTIWGAGVTLLGYWFGSRVPHLDKYIHLVLLGVIAASFGLAILHILKDERSRKLVIAKGRQTLKALPFIGRS